MSGHHDSTVATNALGIHQQDRPCARCVKRNIGHLCHDERREPLKRLKGDKDGAIGHDDTVPKREGSLSDGAAHVVGQQLAADQPSLQETDLALTPATLPTIRQIQPQPSAQPSPAMADGMPEVGLNGHHRKAVE